MANHSIKIPEVFQGIFGIFCIISNFYIEVGAQNVKPFKFCLASIFCRKISHITHPVSTKVSRTVSSSRTFSVSTILPEYPFKTNVCLQLPWDTNNTGTLNVEPFILFLQLYHMCKKFQTSMEYVVALENYSNVQQNTVVPVMWGWMQFVSMAEKGRLTFKQQAKLVVFYMVVCVCCCNAKTFPCTSGTWWAPAKHTMYILMWQFRKQGSVSDQNTRVIQAFSRRRTCKVWVAMQGTTVNL